MILIDAKYATVLCLMGKNLTHVDWYSLWYEPARVQHFGAFISVVIVSYQNM